MSAERTSRTSWWASSPVPCVSTPPPCQETTSKTAHCSVSSPHTPQLPFLHPCSHHKGLHSGLLIISWVMWIRYPVFHGAAGSWDSPPAEEQTCPWPDYQVSEKNLSPIIFKWSLIAREMNFNLYVELPPSSLTACSFYKSNYVQRFHYSRPVRKGPVDPNNEFAVSDGLYRQWDSFTIVFFWRDSGL